MHPEMSKKLPSGEEVTIQRDGKFWEVDMWKPNGENHWNRRFRDYESALLEYQRWN